MVNIEQGYWKVQLPELEPNRHHEADYRTARAPDVLKAGALTKLIPPDASVCTTGELLVQLSSRRKIYQFNRHHYSTFTGRDYMDADYFLLPVDGETWIRPKVRRRGNFSKAFREFEKLNTEIVAESPPYVLYRQVLERDSHSAATLR